MNREFQKQLDSIVKSKPIKTDMPSFFTPKLPTSVNFGSQSVLDSIKETTILTKLFYLFAAIFSVLIILIVINFTIYPIFPDSIVSSVPGMNDVKLYWDNAKDRTAIALKDQPISDMFANYTCMVDVQIDNPTSLIGRPRVFVVRGDLPSTAVSTINSYMSPTGNITVLSPNFNFIIYCSPESTDLNISVMTTTPTNTLSFESVQIPNFPIQTSVRIGIVLLTSMIEVYVNGSLFKTRNTTPLRSQLSPIHAPEQISSSTAPFGRVQNLRLWRRVLSAQEIRSYGAGSSFEKAILIETAVLASLGSGGSSANCQS
jgi:hypothetical protein